MTKYLWLFSLLLVCASASAQEKTVVIKGATIYTITGAPIPTGVMIVQKGKIISVGPASMPIPNDATVIDATGKVLMPGLIDSHSHLGGPEGGDASAALHPDARAMDAVNPTSDG